MTIRHRVAKYLGMKQVPQSVFAHVAGCGAQILSLTQFPVGQEVTLGKEPHVFCARCFPNLEEGSNVTMPTDIAATPVYDERGNLIPLRDDDQSQLGRPMPDRGDLGRPTPVDRGDLGTLDNRPWG